MARPILFCVPIKSVIIGILFCILSAQLKAQEIIPSPTFTDVPLNSLSFFKKASEKWTLAGALTLGPYSTYKRTIAEGVGNLVHTSVNSDAEPLTSINEYGDIALDFAFMLTPGATLNVYLQGRYGITLTDSWQKANVGTALVCGSVLEKAGDPTSISTPARLNACRAPGLWQRIQILFRAPRFNDRKISNAAFARVSLNGMVLYENLELAGPSTTSSFSDELAKGPLVFVSNSVVAVKNIRFTEPADGNFTMLMKPEANRNIRDRPIYINPANKTLVQRCFIDYQGKKQTVCMAVGQPDSVHYAMDLSRGSLINFWKGGFIDATSMWTERGEYQIAQPMGAKIEVRPVPTFALLSNANQDWPSSGGDGFRFNGYRLATDGSPTFMYRFNELFLEDSVRPANQSSGLVRTLRITSGTTSSSLWIRLAGGTTITPVGTDLFVVGDHEYYVKLSKHLKGKSTVRKSVDGQELILPGSVLLPAFSYELIW